MVFKLPKRYNILVFLKGKNMFIIGNYSGSGVHGSGVHGSGVHGSGRDED